MIQGFKNACRAGLRVHTQIQSYSSSSTTVKNEWRKRRNIIFDNELEKLKNSIGRIEKVTVKYYPIAKDEEPKEMVMNKYLSTPNECARHMSEDIHKTAALALVNGAPWDLHRPFENDCELKILTMQMPQDSPALNPAFWRTCSFVLGAMIDSVFKDDIQLYLHSFPRPNIKSGSFVYDVVLDLPEWRPTDAEMRALSAQFVKITNDALPVERLEITEDLAIDMFQDNPFKSKQIPEIAKSNDGKITLYRIGNHIDISKGPMVGHTNIIGRATIAAVHKIESEETDRMYRFQGAALPRGVYLNHIAYGILEERAKKLNTCAYISQKMPETIEIQDTIAVQN